MKILCKCGGIIYDQTDFLPNKGYVISDQDWFDLLDAMDRAIEKLGPTILEKEKACMHIRSLMTKLSKPIYQCQKCGCLFVFNEKKELEAYNKTYPFEGNSVLKSSFGLNWKGTLIGEWRESREGESKGYIWHNDISDREGSFCNWNDLEERYYSIFNELRERDILRSAILKKNNEVLHSWEYDCNIL